MANPLTLILPLESGVDLQKLLTALATNSEAINTALTSVGTVHFARFIVFDASTENLQPSLSAGSADGAAGGNGYSNYRLAVITEYDGSFNAYIQDFVNSVGQIFDLLLSFTADGKQCIPVAKNVAAFQAYIAKNDASQHAPNNTLFSAYPQTVQQILAAF
jgi:hypothetical protein